MTDTISGMDSTVVALRATSARVAVIGAVISLCGSSLPGQGAAVLRADSARRTVMVSRAFAVPLVLDMSATTGLTVASIQANIGFPANRMAFDSIKAGALITERCYRCDLR